MRPTGKEGFLYGVTFGAAVTGGADAKLAEGGWHKIKSRGAAESGIPQKDPKRENDRDLREGDVYWAEAGQKLAAGDALIPMTLKKLSFTTDVSAAAQGQAIDVSTQLDVETGARAYEPSAFKEQSGSINGLVDVDSEEQRLLANEFSQVNVQDGSGHVSVSASGSRVHHLMISYRESRTPGETEMWRYFPVIVESFQMDKPIDGAVPFNFNYKVDGKSRPAIIYRTVPEKNEIPAGPEDPPVEPEEPSGNLPDDGE